VKFNVNRVDNMVIQAIFLLDTLDKDINSFSMRVRSVSFFLLPHFLLTVCSMESACLYLSFSALVGYFGSFNMVVV
jgi:hypothetical protein